MLGLDRVCTNSTQPPKCLTRVRNGTFLCRGERQSSPAPLNVGCGVCEDEVHASCCPAPWGHILSTVFPQLVTQNPRQAKDIIFAKILRSNIWFADIAKLCARDTSGEGNGRCVSAPQCPSNKEGTVPLPLSLERLCILERAGRGPDPAVVGGDAPALLLHQPGGSGDVLCRPAQQLQHGEFKSTAQPGGPLPTTKGWPAPRGQRGLQRQCAQPARLTTQPSPYQTPV